MNYPLGRDFPHEGFVQDGIESYFKRKGFMIEDLSFIDLAVRHPETGETWVIEAKGRTSQVGLDFRTGLGQIIQNMNSESVYYALAMPDIPKFKRQRDKVSGAVRRLLNLHWIIVGADGQVTIDSPPT